MPDIVCHHIEILAGTPEDLFSPAAAEHLLHRSKNRRGMMHFARGLGGAPDKIRAVGAPPTSCSI